MVKTYVTFGQEHVHRVNNKTFDCDCVAVVDGGRDRVVELFELRFCFTYTQEQLDNGQLDMSYYPRGVLEV